MNKIGRFGIFERYKRAKTGVLIVSKITKGSNRSFWHFCSLQQDQNGRREAFENFRDLPNDLLDENRYVKEHNPDK